MFLISCQMLPLSSWPQCPTDLRQPISGRKHKRKCGWNGDAKPHKSKRWVNGDRCEIAHCRYLSLITGDMRFAETIRHVTNYVTSRQPSNGLFVYSRIFGTSASSDIFSWLPTYVMSFEYGEPF